MSATALLGLSACGTESTSSEDSQASVTGARVVVSYENGLAVLDGTTLEVVETMASEEFLRLNPAGDGRHVMVTTSKGFQLLDSGAGTEGGEPELTDTVFKADTPGHVVSHAGNTVLYADGTSDSTVLETAAIEEGVEPVRTIEGEEAHHGVSVILEDGTMVTTVGDAETRSGAVALDADGELIDESDECPGVHGEGTAPGEVVVLGCEDGALLFKDGAFEKLEAPDQPYGRTGNAYVSETSPIVVGDYNTDPDAEGVTLDSMTLLDTEAEILEAVDLPDGVEYTWQGVDRGPDDMAYILGTDGAVHVLDPATGEVTDEMPVIGAWEGPAEWQDAHPFLEIEGDVAYVTEPATSEVHALDLTTGEVVASVTTDAPVNELAVATAG